MLQKYIGHKEKRKSEKSLVREWCGCDWSILMRMELKVLKWFDYVKKINRGCYVYWKN